MVSPSTTIAGAPEDSVAVPITTGRPGVSVTVTDPRVRTVGLAVEGSGMVVEPSTTRPFAPSLYVWLPITTAGPPAEIVDPEMTIGWPAVAVMVCEPTTITDVETPAAVALGNAMVVEPSTTRPFAPSLKVWLPITAAGPPTEIVDPEMTTGWPAVAVIVREPTVITLELLAATGAAAVANEIVLEPSTTRPALPSL